MEESWEAAFHPASGQTTLVIQLVRAVTDCAIIGTCGIRLFGVDV